MAKGIFFTLAKLAKVIFALGGSQSVFICVEFTTLNVSVNRQSAKVKDEELASLAKEIVKLREDLQNH